MRTYAKLMLAGLLAVALSGCLTKRTVTQDGFTVDEGYRFKRPLKEAFSN